MDLDTDAPETYLTFTDALFAVIGVPTDDRRMLHSDIELNMRDFPIPLQWQETTSDGHKGSVTVGVIESMRRDGDKVFASGYMLNNEHAAKALDLLQHGVAKPSVDMADATAILAFSDGTEVTKENFDPDVPVYETYRKATVTAATIVAIPAFGQTGLSLNAEREARGGATTDEAALVAAAHAQPVYEPSLFAEADKNLLRTMRLTLDPESGRVFGFIATWKDQHRSVGLGNIKPPRSSTAYEHFHTSPGVHLSNGTVLPVGRLTVGIGHAPTRGVSAAMAQSHYDNVEACWALGRISEHRLGIFFSGVVAPWASPEKVQMGLASPVSGDWRPIGPGRSLELVAVLSVNTPGFLCKVETDDTGSPLAMVASMGAVDEVTKGLSPSAQWSLDDLRVVMRDVLDQREADHAVNVRLAAASARAMAILGEPVESSMSMRERIADGLARIAATDIEFGIRKVKDANYWGLPVGTPLKKGQKPRGKAKGGKTNSPRTLAKANAAEGARLEKSSADKKAAGDHVGARSDANKAARARDEARENGFKDRESKQPGVAADKARIENDEGFDTKSFGNLVSDAKADGQAKRYVTNGNGAKITIAADKNRGKPGVTINVHTGDPLKGKTFTDKQQKEMSAHIAGLKPAPKA